MAGIAAAWAAGHLDDGDAVLIVDETADEKSSADAGAARQYSGAAGGVCSTDSPVARRRSTVCSMSSVTTGGRPPVPALAGCGVESLQGGFADALSLGLGHGGEEPEEHPPGTAGLVDAGQRAGQHLQDQAVGGEVVGERGELGGVAAVPLHLTDGEQHPAVGGMGLDLAGGGEGCLELGADPDAGADLLGEDLVATDAVRVERVQLRLQFLGEVRAAGVPDADVGARGVGDGGVGGGVPGRQGWPGPRSVGGGRHAQQFGEPGDLLEPAGVVDPGDGAATRAARRAGLDLAA